MQSFLQYAAHDLYDRVEGDFQDVTVVFPNKRASLFFNQYLCEKADGGTMWAPRYITISELFASMSNMIVANPVQLICQLYEVFRRHFPNDERTLDELYPLLEMMLADFQDVDSNMVAADKIFRNVKELQDMSDYSFLTEEQVKAIQHFFNGLDWLNGTAEQRKFATLWDKLLDIYNDYRDALLATETPMVYEGLLKREVVESLNSNASKLKTQNSRLYAFIGFNVLSRTEQRLLRIIKENCNALFYWDYDEAFMQGASVQGGAYPGSFIKENIEAFGCALPKDAPIYKNMRMAKKSITFIQSPTENAQARYLNKWVADNVARDSHKPTDNAIVMCNESLLQPVLHSIPNIEGLTLNVTMGYPLTDTPAYSLVQALLELQLRGRARSGSWRHKQVSSVLKHPYIRRITHGSATMTLAKLTSQNIIFPTDEAFADDPLLSIIFKRHTGNELTAWLAEVLSLAANQCVKGWDGALFQESIFAAYTAVNRLHAMRNSLPSLAELKDGTTARLINQALQRVAVPFHGEPAEGLQVMGFLETRNLDFRNVVLLSADDSQMPRASKRPSLIPYTLQSAFGMTTIDKEVSIYAYYFYRLMARAESVTVLWNSSTEDGHKGEMSQFMMQMLCEADKLFHPEQTIALKQFVTPMEAMKPSTLSVEKDEKIMERLQERFNKDSILSPSAINYYLQCPLKFFFRYIARLRPDDDVAEDVDDATFGTIFHDVMDKLYKPYVGRQLTSSMLRTMAKDKATLCKLLDEGFNEKLFKCEGSKAVSLSGASLIKHNVLQVLLQKQLLLDAHTAEQAESNNGSLTLLALEEEHSIERDIKIEGDDKPFTVKLGGIIDRIDMVDDGVKKTIRVVDYKTSVSPQTATDLTQLFDPKGASECYHITQTLYYCDVLCSEPRDKNYGADAVPVVPAIMYYKNNLKLESPVLKLYDNPGEKHAGRKPVIESYTADCREYFQQRINEVIGQIFSPQERFTAHEDAHNCTYCDFKNMCVSQEKHGKV